VGGAVADTLKIKDFYSAHLMTYCEGDFKPDAKDENAKEDVTFCSARKAFFAFDPTAIIEDQLPDGFGLSDLKWPQQVTDGLKVVKVASRAMYFFYLVGIALAALGMIGSCFGLVAYEHKVALANLAVNSVSQFQSSY
jgi:SUR7/PalI family